MKKKTTKRNRPVRISKRQAQFDAIVQHLTARIHDAASEASRAAAAAEDADNSVGHASALLEELKHMAVRP